VLLFVEAVVAVVLLEVELVLWHPLNASAASAVPAANNNTCFFIKGRE
jgi:hypothetical protein